MLTQAERAESQLEWTGVTQFLVAVGAILVSISIFINTDKIDKIITLRIISMLCVIGIVIMCCFILIVLRHNRYSRFFIEKTKRYMSTIYVDIDESFINTKEHVQTVNSPFNNNKYKQEIIQLYPEKGVIKGPSVINLILTIYSAFIVIFILILLWVNI